MLYAPLQPKVTNCTPLDAFCALSICCMHPVANVQVVHKELALFSMHELTICLTPCRMKSISALTCVTLLLFVGTLDVYGGLVEPACDDKNCNSSCPQNVACLANGNVSLSFTCRPCLQCCTADLLTVPGFHSIQRSADASQLIYFLHTDNLDFQPAATRRLQDSLLDWLCRRARSGRF